MFELRISNLTLNMFTRDDNIYYVMIKHDGVITRARAYTQIIVKYFSMDPNVHT